MNISIFNLPNLTAFQLLLGICQWPFHPSFGPTVTPYVHISLAAVDVLYKWPQSYCTYCLTSPCIILGTWSHLCCPEVHDCFTIYCSACGCCEVDHWLLSLLFVYLSVEGQSGIMLSCDYLNNILVWQQEWNIKFWLKVLPSLAVACGPLVLSLFSKKTHLSDILSSKY